MGLTFNQLKQGIQDFLENSAASFTTATGSGKAPIEAVSYTHLTLPTILPV